MAYRIVWSPEAADVLDKIIIYLEQEWYDSDITHFIEKVTNTLALIESNPYLFRHSTKQHIHEVLISRHNLLIYEVDEKAKRINLLTILDSRSNPRKKAKTIRKIKPKS